MFCVTYNTKKEIVIRCKPCMNDIVPGKKEKCLWNFKDHMTRKSHVLKVMNFKDHFVKKQMASALKSDFDPVTQRSELYEQINIKFPNTFSLSKSGDMILCDVCPKTLIKIHAKGGSCLRNSTEHVNSKEHQKNVEFRKRQKSVAFFFNSKA